MTQRTSLAGAAALLIALGAVPAQAAERPGSGTDPFAMMDADSNGRVTIEEMRSFAATRFTNLDSDRNGLLSRAEFDAGRAALAAAAAANGTDAPSGGRAGRAFGRLDADSNGSLSQTEYLARTDRVFPRADRDSDGALSQEEWTAFRERMRRFLGSR